LAREQFVSWLSDQLRKRQDTMTVGRIFGTDGIRAVAGKWPLTPEFVMRLGQAIGRVLPTLSSDPVLHAQAVIGRDTRLSGPMLESAIAAGLLSSGVDVHYLDVISSPGVAHLTRVWGMQVGIVVSASHNSYLDNGIKLYGPDGFKLPDAVEVQIENLAVTQDALTSAAGTALGRAFRRPEGEDTYCQFLMAGWKEGSSLGGMRILLDCADGSVSALAPRIFRALGAECLVCHARPDGLNINSSYEYLTPHNLARLVVQERADLGIAFDGDGDRVIFVDEQGEFVNGDVILAILARAMRESGTLSANGVVATVMSNMGLEISLEEVGIQLERTPVGDRCVTERMRERGFALGGEQAGHIIVLGRGHTTGDGLHTALMLCEALVSRQATLSELAACMRRVPQILISEPVTSKPCLRDLPAICARVSEAEATLGRQGRILLRYSGTEPMLRIMIEGSDQARIEDLAQGIAAAVRRELG
jgi:phosphoglucosamine mutase